jgi:hypothetical protein
VALLDEIFTTSVDYCSCIIRLSTDNLYNFIASGYAWDALVHGRIGLGRSIKGFAEDYDLGGQRLREWKTAHINIVLHHPSTLSTVKIHGWHIDC